MALKWMGCPQGRGGWHIQPQPKHPLPPATSNHFRVRSFRSQHCAGCCRLHSCETNISPAPRKLTVQQKSRYISKVTGQALESILTAWPLVSPWSSNPRDQGGGCDAFYGLTSEVVLCHFYRMLLGKAVTQVCTGLRGGNTPHLLMKMGQCHLVRRTGDTIYLSPSYEVQSATLESQ